MQSKLTLVAINFLRIFCLLLWITFFFRSLLRRAQWLRHAWGGRTVTPTWLVSCDTRSQASSFLLWLPPAILMQNMNRAGCIPKFCLPTICNHAFLNSYLIKLKVSKTLEKYLQVWHASNFWASQVPWDVFRSCIPNHFSKVPPNSVYFKTLCNDLKHRGVWKTDIFRGHWFLIKKISNTFPKFSNFYKTISSWRLIEIFSQTIGKIFMVWFL